MSGIIGKFSFDPHEPLARPALEQTLDALRRRHASRDIFAAPGIALGATGDPGRTEIAAQELPSQRVAADSAITNAPARRRELTAKGHTFATDTDSELLLRAYVAWGTGLFARLRGPFACAIWDGAARRLMLARDHVGIRPLYFALLPNHGVVFASEVRALLSPRFDGRGVVSRLRLRQLWDEHRRGACHGHRLWALLMLEFWFRTSIDGDAVAGPFEYAGKAA